MTPTPVVPAGEMTATSGLSWLNQNFTRKCISIQYTIDFTSLNFNFIQVKQASTLMSRIAYTYNHRSPMLTNVMGFSFHIA